MVIFVLIAASPGTLKSQLKATTPSEDLVFQRTACFLSELVVKGNKLPNLKRVRDHSFDLLSMLNRSLNQPLDGDHVSYSEMNVLVPLLAYI